MMNVADLPSTQEVSRFTHRAMATLYEVVIAGEDPAFASQAAQAVFEELDRLELELSRFLPNSDVARINNLAPNQETRVGADTFECLKLARLFWTRTHGAFDPTVGALMDALVRREWMSPHAPSDALEQARRVSGMGLVELKESTHSVRVLDPVPRIDLGAIGKGYAVDRAVELLKEWGVGSALVHGGSSSVCAYGAVSREKGWPVTMSDPEEPHALLERMVLCDRSLSGSGVRRARHIVDPRSGQLAHRCIAAWVSSRSAAESDALSTACMVMGPGEIERLQRESPDFWGMTVSAGASGRVILRFGPMPDSRTSSA